MLVSNCGCKVVYLTVRVTWLVRFVTGFIVTIHTHDVVFGVGSEGRQGKRLGASCGTSCS